MKNVKTFSYAIVLVVIAAALTSCQKGSLSADPVSSAKNASSSSAIATTGNILIAATVSSTTTATDSVFLMHACPPGRRPDTVAFSGLPASVGAYLTANYAGYTFQKAFKVLDRAGNADGYVVAINYNSKPVGLKFDTSGTFTEVLEQRERPDVDGAGWHPGGCFDNRNGMHQDTMAISALPAAIKSYLATNYATDTLVHAVVTHDTTYIVYSVNKGLFATAFSSKLVFVKRIQLNPRPERHVPVLQANLPAATTTYLATTYAGYVFDKAFAEKQNGTIDKYIVLIDASGTRYAVEFDGTGKFVKSTTIK